MDPAVRLMNLWIPIVCANLVIQAAQHAAAQGLTVVPPVQLRSSYQQDPAKVYVQVVLLRTILIRFV